MPSPGNVVIGQSGGPTAVINQTLIGVAKEALRHPQTFLKVYGAIHGIQGIIDGNFCDFAQEDPANLEVGRILFNTNCAVCHLEHLRGKAGNAAVVGRKSPKSLYSDALVTFEDDRGAYDQKDAAGFIRLNALRLRLIAARNARVAKPG